MPLLLSHCCKSKWQCNRPAHTVPPVDKFWRRLGLINIDNILDIEQKHTIDQGWSLGIKGEIVWSGQRMTGSFEDPELDHTFIPGEVPSLQRRFRDLEQGGGTLGASAFFGNGECESGIRGRSPSGLASIDRSMDFEANVEVLPR